MPKGQYLEARVWFLIIYRQYIAEWSALTSLLTNPTSTPRFGVTVPGSSGEKSSLKEASATFFELLTELEQLCSQYPLNRQDPDLRDRVGREVEDMVGAAYGAFCSRCSGKGLEKCTPSFRSHES